MIIYQNSFVVFFSYFFFKKIFFFCFFFWFKFNTILIWVHVSFHDFHSLKIIFFFFNVIRWKYFLYNRYNLSCNPLNMLYYQKSWNLKIELIHGLCCVIRVNGSHLKRLCPFILKLFFFLYKIFPIFVFILVEKRLQR